MILIIGAGIGGLTLALKLHSLGISSRIYESVPVLKPLGVGINILPHAMRELCGLGLEQQIAQRGIETRGKSNFIIGLASTYLQIKEVDLLVINGLSFLFIEGCCNRFWLRLFWKEWVMTR